MSFFHLLLSKKMSWKNCSRISTFQNISDELFVQMKSTDAILKRNEIEHSIVYGSLLGAVNFHDINPREVDNDFVVPFNFSITNELFADFKEAGLLLFKYGIFRVCRRAVGATLKNDDHPPWFRTGNHYTPYSDLYPTRFLPTFYEPSFGETYLKGWSTTQIRVRNTFISSPNVEFRTRFLRLKYGNSYMNPNNHKEELDDKWKQKIRHRQQKWSRIHQRPDSTFTH